MYVPLSAKCRPLFWIKVLFSESRWSITSLEGVSSHRTLNKCSVSKSGRRLHSIQPESSEAFKFIILCVMSLFVIVRKRTTHCVPLEVCSPNILRDLSAHTHRLCKEPLILSWHIWRKQTFSAVTFKAEATSWGKRFHYLFKKEQLQACWNATQLIITAITIRVLHTVYYTLG